MKRNFLQCLTIGLLIWFVVPMISASVQETLAAIPNIGDGRLVVCGQNARNYFVVNYTADRSGCKDLVGVAGKDAKDGQCIAQYRRRHLCI